MFPLINETPEIMSNWTRYLMAMTRAFGDEVTEINRNLLIATQLAVKASHQNPLTATQVSEVAKMIFDSFTTGVEGIQSRLADYAQDHLKAGSSALINSLYQKEGEKFSDYLKREADVMESVANFSHQIEGIKDEFGFQFHTAGYEHVAETACFNVYQVLPTHHGVEVNKKLKPMLLVPPYMLGVHILAFLAGEDKSYAHAFANEGIPTYVRVVKDIKESEELQALTPEDDCLQTAEILAKLMELNGGQQVTLNGTCQGGYVCLINVLSGKLKGLCDSLITNVAPVDGTFSPALSGMPKLHEDYMAVTLPNGNKIANGYMLSFGMRMVAIARETPVARVLDQATMHRSSGLQPGKTPAALFRWLLKERVDMPIAISRMSSLTFEEPIAEDGTLPVKLFDKPLNIKDLIKLKVHWYHDYAIKDDLVTPDCACAADKFLEGSDICEPVAFFGGHVAVLTSPYAKKAPVNGEFVDATGKKARGPVKYQLDISNASGRSRSSGKKSDATANS